MGKNKKNRSETLEIYVKKKKKVQRIRKKHCSRGHLFSIGLVGLVLQHIYSLFVNGGGLKNGFIARAQLCVRRTVRLW